MLYLNQERCTSSMLGSPAGPGAPSQRGIWTSTSIPSAAGFTADGFSKYGIYSLFSGGPTFGSALYSHANAFGRFTSTGQFQPTSGNIFHGSHKVSDSMFSSTGYTFGAPTPPPGSPYSPIPMAQLEFLTKGMNSNIIIQHQTNEFSSSPKKVQITEQRCNEKCCNIKPKSCLCLDDSSSSVNLKGKFPDNNSGCSRTNPIEWGNVNVKKEPGHPCQVAEISTSISPVIKVEVTSPTQKNGENKDFSPINGNIPVGVAVARQRIQQPELINSPSLPPAGLLTTVNAAGQIKEIARLSEIDPTQAGMAASLTAGGAAGGSILQCPEDRNTALASWSIGGTQSSSLSTPTLWQYPEPIQQTVVWPSYPQPSPLLLPPMPPPPPLQLLGSATSDYLSSSATFHQQTQTHSTRLVALTTDTKNKLPLPSTTLIKIEADTSTLDQSKTISTVSSTSGTVFTDQNIAPLVTAHVIYQHPPNLILSQPSTLDTSIKPQITSPLQCLTPPPEMSNTMEEPLLAVDASNQTDSPISIEDVNMSNNNSQEPEVNSTETTSTVDNSTEGKTAITEIPEPIREIPSVPMELEIDEDKTESKKEDEESENIEERQARSKPDISGLELLSNSIVEFESCRNVKTEIQNEEKQKNFHEQTQENVQENQSVDDTLGGLDLLCALAEQRILEESSETCHIRIKEKCKKEKRKSRRYSDEPRHKKHKSDKRSDEERRCKIDLSLKTNPVLKRSASEGNTGDIESDMIKCTCREKKYKSYHTPQSEEDARKFLASRNPTNCCQSEWPCMNAMELDMRIKLAELQRQYKEKQKELSKLNNKKRHCHHLHHHHHHHGCSKKRSRKKSHSDRSDRSETPIQPSIDSVDEIFHKNSSKYEILKPATLCNVEKNKSTKKKRDSIEVDSEESSVVDVEKRRSSVEFRRNSHEKDRKQSSKKRKIERPKRISEHFTPTETIVAKKPRTNSFVGYLIAAKEKLQMSQSFSDSPPRFVDDSTVYNERISKNNNNIVEKSDSLEEDEGWETEGETELSAVKIENQEAENEENLINHICTLTPEHLEMENLRVLTAMGGLFYAGRLHAVEPPDVYSITLDGERGNRPHIMSREEILRDAIVEIAPKSIDELEPGTRLCAYWSQQYRCLYPGTVAEPGSPNPNLDSKFISVEFDDGDNGTISIEDIRLLPVNYPVMEYDPNPLLSLCKRKRRASSSAATVTEIRPSHQLNVIEEPKEISHSQINEDKSDESHHRERKRLKKKKKDKSKLERKMTEKRKKKKHRCSDENCKHRKHHKKHRKHKKHHDKDESSTTLDEKTESDESGIVAEEESFEISDTNIVSVKTEPEIEEETKSFEDIEDDIDEFVPNPEDEVTMDDILEVVPKTKKLRDRQASCESSRSKMSAFLPARQLWSWSGKGYKRPRGKGRGKKEFFKSIQRGKELISVGDAAVFLSTGRPDRPYIGRIEAMWEQCGTMAVRVKWFYHPEETVGCPENLRYPGALFESPHVDENDVQTISHKCEVLPLNDYIETLGNDPKRFATIYENNDIYYLAGYYDPTSTSLKMENGIPSD